MSDVLESFVFYRSFRESIRTLKTKDQLVTLLAICDYALYGMEPELAGVPLAIFTVAKPSIDANKKKRDNGNKGGRPKKETSGFENKNHRFSKCESTETVTETETETVTETETATEAGESEADKPPRPRFVPPTVEQVAEYVKQRGSRVDPQGFIDFYEAKGWKIGKTPMKDWKAACRNSEHWERWQKPMDTRDKVKTAADYNGREEDVFLSCKM